MTRVLSELLGAREPGFRLGLKQLEDAAGQPSADIRLTTEIAHATKDKLREFGLDPNDTTGPELYNALQARLVADTATMHEVLGTGGRPEELMPQVQRLLQSLDIPKKTFALKSSVAKRLLKNHPPKRAMKALGYRSIDSMLKHEAIAQLYAAAWISESAPWHKALLTSYKKLAPVDFEMRDIAIISPTAKRWEKLSESYVTEVKHNILTFKELGAIVLLPLPAKVAENAALAVTLLALHAVNDIRTTSSYLKLHQVRPDFGTVLEQVARSEPFTEANLAGQRLPWRLIQRFLAHEKTYVQELFEPHVQSEDLRWESAENIVAKLHSRFEFWQNGAHLGLLDGGQPISFNLTDAALNFCNKLPYEQRVVHYLRDHVWHELMMRYLHQDNLERSVREQLSGELVEQPELV
jgi:hypothetical protein